MWQLKECPSSLVQTHTLLFSPIDFIHPYYSCRYIIASLEINTWNLYYHHHHHHHQSDPVVKRCYWSCSMYEASAFTLFSFLTLLGFCWPTFECLLPSNLQEGQWEKTIITVKEKVTSHITQSYETHKAIQGTFVPFCRGHFFWRDISPLLL